LLHVYGSLAGCWAIKSDALDGLGEHSLARGSTASNLAQPASARQNFGVFSLAVLMPAAVALQQGETTTGVLSVPSARSGFA